MGDSCWRMFCYPRQCGHRIMTRQFNWSGPAARCAATPLVLIVAKSSDLRESAARGGFLRIHSALIRGQFRAEHLVRLFFVPRRVLDQMEGGGLHRSTDPTPRPQENRRVDPCRWNPIFKALDATDVIYWTAPTPIAFCTLRVAAGRLPRTISSFSTITGKAPPPAR